MHEWPKYVVNIVGNSGGGISLFQVKNGHDFMENLVYDAIWETVFQREI